MSFLGGGGFSGIPATGILRVPHLEIEGMRHNIPLMSFFWGGGVQWHPCYGNLSCAPPRNRRNETLFRLCRFFGGGVFSGIPVTGIFRVPHPEIEGMRHTIPLMSFDSQCYVNDEGMSLSPTFRSFCLSMSLSLSLFLSLSISLSFSLLLSVSVTFPFAFSSSHPHTCRITRFPRRAQFSPKES